MAKLQRWKRRDPAPAGPVEAPDDTSVHASASGSGADRPTLVEEAEPEPEPEPVPDADPEGRRTTGGRLRSAIADSGPVALLLAAHPRQALATGAGLGLVALAADRPLREAAVVAATGVVGQTVLGWHNDIVDRTRDRRHQAPRKPLAEGRIETGSVWYALVVAVLLVVPLSVSTGVLAGVYYLGALAVGLLGNIVLRRGKLSWVSWAAQYALYVPYLTYGGWGGRAEGDAPEIAMVVLFALLGIGVHFLRAIWGLVADDADRWTYLPLVLGRRLGASRLLAVSAAYSLLVVAAIVVVGGSVGLRR